MGLSLDQADEMARDLTLEAYLDELKNKSIYDKYFPFTRAVTSFKSHIIEFSIEAKNKNKTKAGTITKTEIKKMISISLGNALSLTKDYAIQKNLSGMQEMVTISDSEIFTMKAADVLPLVQNLIENVFKPALFLNSDFIKYELTSVMIDDILANAVLYNSRIGKNTQTSNISSVANTKIDSIIDLIHIDIESMENTINVFSDAFPDFIDGFNKNKIILKTGIHHQGIQGMVYNNGKLQPNALIQILGTDKSTTSDETGAYKLIYMKVGTYSAQAKNENGDAALAEVVITQRHITTVDFHLV